jgi:hypothetical protein
MKYRLKGICKEHDEKNVIQLYAEKAEQVEVADINIIKTFGNIETE